MIKNASSYIALYPVLRNVQSALHFTSLTDLFTQTPSLLLWEASIHMLQLMREGCPYTYPPLSMARYSFIQPSELAQCRVKNLAQGFNTAAQDSNPSSRSREPGVLPLSHCALHDTHLVVNDSRQEGVGLEGRTQFDLGVDGQESFLYLSPLATRHIQTRTCGTFLSTVLKGCPDCSVHDTFCVSGRMHEVEVLASTF